MAQKKTYKRSRFSSFVNCAESHVCWFCPFQKLVGAFEHNFCPGSGNFNKPIFKSSNTWGAARKKGGMSKIPIDWCISNKRQPNINHYVTKLECVHFWGNGVSVIWKYAAADHNNPNINRFINCLLLHFRGE